MKPLSPIPLLIYFLGMYVEKKNKLNVTFNIIEMSITSSDALLFSGVVVIFLYLLYMKKLIGLYQYHLKEYYDFKNDALKLEAKLKKKSNNKN